MKKLTYDLRGQVCPSTLLQTLKHVNSNKNGLKKQKIAILILTDHRDALSTIPDTIEKMGFSFNIEKTSDAYKIKIFKN